jgi:hypothetical protein
MYFGMREAALRLLDGGLQHGFSAAVPRKRSGDDAHPQSSARIHL